MSSSEQNDTIVRGACPHDCPDTCALLVTVRDGKAVKVAGDPLHPPTHGALCTKVARYTERTYHRDRLQTPLKRIGKKGEGRFEAISWEEAVSSIAARLTPLAKSDPQSILPYSYAGTMGLVQGEAMAGRFFNKLGASQLNRTICSAAGMAGLNYTIGGRYGMELEAYAKSRLILIWGSNSITSNLHFWTFAQQAKRDGAILVAIDPLRTDTAAKCHHHIAIRPGTDAALALAMADILIKEGLTDNDYIAQHTLGFEHLVQRAAEFPVERAAAICGIEANVIVELARMYGTISPAAIRLNYGVQRTRSGANAVRAIASLPALTGAWRHASGGVLLSSSQSVPENPELTRPDLRVALPGNDRVVNMSTIGDALTQDDSIKALIVYNSNPVAVAPESEAVIKGFAREDLFTVVLEHFQTDTADYADIVLPATTQLEHFDLHKTYGHTYLLVNEAAIAPLGQAKPNSEIFRLLARAMGFTDRAFSASDEELARAAVQWDSPRLGGQTLDTLRQSGWTKMHIPAAPFANGNFPTPSGKCEFYSERLALLGKDPLPNYLEPHEPATQEFPLICLSPPARNFLNSTFVNIESLRAKSRSQEVMLHPQDAQRRSLKQGQQVEVFNQRGVFQAIANISEDTRPGVIAAWGVWWHKLTTSGRNVNAVTSQALTDLGESPTFYDCRVQVRAISAAMQAT